MIGRRRATKAGAELNRFAEAQGSEQLTQAVRTANAVIFQYYLIPRAIREEYFREELVADGVQLRAAPEE